MELSEERAISIVSFARDRGLFCEEKISARFCVTFCATHGANMTSAADLTRFAKSSSERVRGLIKSKGPPPPPMVSLIVFCGISWLSLILCFQAFSFLLISSFSSSLRPSSSSSSSCCSSFSISPSASSGKCILWFFGNAMGVENSFLDRLSQKKKSN